MFAQQSLQPKLSRRRYASVSYALQNNTVFSGAQNWVRVSDGPRTDNGSEFQSVGPETAQHKTVTITISKCDNCDALQLEAAPVVLGFDLVVFWFCGRFPETAQWLISTALKSNMAEGRIFKCLIAILLGPRSFNFANIWYSVWSRDSRHSTHVQGQGSTVKVTAWRNVTTVKL